MAFNVQSFVPVSSSGNTDIIQLPDGTYIGGPALYTYITNDTLTEVETSGYFNNQAGILNVYDRVYVRASDGSRDYYISTVSFNPTNVEILTDGISGNVDGPASSTDNAIARWDGAGGDALQNSGILIDDSNAVSGITSLDVDNININGNTVISTDTNGNINLTPNGTGINVLANAQVTALTASRAVVTDASKNLTSSAVTSTELGYVSGVTSAIQTQLNALSGQTSRAINQVAHGLSVGNIVYIDGSGDFQPAIASAAATAEAIGIVTAVAGVDDFTLQFGGYISAGLSGLTPGAVQYLSPSSAGDLTETKPTTAGQVIKPLIIADSATSGYWTNYLGVLI